MIGQRLTWVGRAVGVTVGLSLLERALSVGGNLLLARFVLPGEFGAFALASSVAGLSRSFQLLGARQLLVSTRSASLASASRRMLRVSGGATVFVATLLFLAGPVVARAYDAPQVAFLVRVFAVAALFDVVWPVAAGVLGNRLEVVRAARYETVAAALQFTVSVVLAVLGLGSTSLAVGYLSSSLVLALLGAVVLVPTLTGRAARETLGGTERVGPELRVLAVNSLGQSALVQGDYLVLGAFMGAQQLGYYYFAYQLASQVGSLVASNAQKIATPLLGKRARLSPDVSAHLRRITRALAIASAVAAGGLLATFMVADRFVWSGQWTPALPALVALVAAYPARSVFAVSKIYRIAKRQVGLLTRRTWLLATALVASAVVVGLLRPTALGAGVGVGGTLAVGSVMILLADYREAGFRVGDFAADVRGLLPPFVIGGAALVLCAADTGRCGVVTMMVVGVTVAASTLLVCRGHVVEVLVSLGVGRSRS